jgi:lysophospholipase L1-like esterase
MRPLAFGWSLLFCLAATAAAGPVLRPDDRLAICGDSMTANLGYSVYIEDYLLASQPVAGLEVSQFGWGGQTAETFLARLGTDLVPFKPTIVTTCFGMNDNLDRYRKAQSDLVKALKKAGVRTIIIGSPKCVDSALYHRDPAQAAIRNRSLAALADIAKDVAATEGVLYADVFGATMAAMIKAKAQNGERYQFDGADGFLPGDLCNLAMAYAFLKSLGCGGDIGTLTADFSAGKAEGTLGHTIVAFRDRTMTVESSRYPFYFPGHGFGPQDPSPFPLLKCVPFSEELNRYMLVVTNLPTAVAKITWGPDASHDFSADELGKGVNLAAAFPANPFTGRCQDVDGAVRDQVQQERISGHSFVNTNVEDVQGLAKRDDWRRKAVKRVVPVTHTFTIQPLSPVDKQPKSPIPVIVDTDMNSDCDDVGAVALLNTFMNQGEATLIGCIVNTHDAALSSSATIQAINVYYGHSSIPIGAYHGEPGPSNHMTSVLLPAPAEGYHALRRCSSHYTKKVHQRFAPDFPDDDKLPAGVDVYRAVLASATDGTVVIVSLGLLENLQDLVQSQPDRVSALSGLDLVRTKVRKLVVMANTTHEDAYVLRKWPTPILWTTYVGTTIYTGKALVHTPEDNPVRCAYGLFGDGKYNAIKDGRQSWDLTASWLAVRGSGELWDEISGYWRVDPPGGYGTWINDLSRKDRLVIPKMPSQDVAKLIDAELSRPPKR